MPAPHPGCVPLQAVRGLRGETRGAVRGAAGLAALKGAPQDPQASGLLLRPHRVKEEFGAFVALFFYI